MQSQRHLESTAWNWALTPFVHEQVGKCEINGFFVIVGEHVGEHLEGEGAGGKEC